MTTPGQKAWHHANLALTLYRLSPELFGGISIRARSGPVRDAFLAALTHLDHPPLRIHPAMSREALFGGMDLAQTLSQGQIVTTPGILATQVTPILTMAERCQRDRAAELAAWLDNTNGTLIVLDEGSEPGEASPPALTERLAFQVNLEGIGRLEARAIGKVDLSGARQAFPNVITSADATALIVTLAARLGIESLRAPLFALRAAQALAALDNRLEISEIDLEIAATLVLAPRAICLPETPSDAPADTQEKPSSKGQNETQMPLDDILVEAIKPHLPDDILSGTKTVRIQRAKGVGAGQKRKSNRRGRPLPSRPGRIGQDARIDLVATLRAAAPWQGLRKRGDGPVRVAPSDIRIRRYEEKSDRLVIFSVDASGSSAMARLAEAKGAVEVLLTQAYSSRDHVALIAFRGTEAELLLPPTRSLVQTKRRLAALPGGGGTPLATGLKAAGELAMKSQARGLSPTIALLTDGRANIALDGSPDRTAAGDDARKMAQWLRTEAIASVVFDTGMRPEASLKRLAQTLDARYLPLPRADARALGKALYHELDA